MHRLLRTSLVISLFCCCSMLAATTTSDLIEAIGKVEKYIKVKYSEEVQLKIAKTTLDKIVSSKEPNDSKLQRLIIEFPEAFTQKLLFHKPLSITIHGFDIGWDVTQERNITTSNTIRDKYSKEIQAIEDDIKNGRVIIDEEGSVSTTLTTDYNVVTENVSSILKVIFEGKVSVKDSYEKIEKDTIVQRYFFAKCRENIRNDIQHTKTMNQHLIFTITLKNNSGEKLTVPRDEMNVPVYYSKAKSANIYAKPKINKVYEILPGSTIDIIMRADLDTTNALALVDFMRYSEPVIRFDNSGTKIITPSGRNVLRESFDTNDKITLSLICRYPNVKRDWYFEKINPTTGKKTTYYDIFKEIENQNSGQRVFFLPQRFCLFDQQTSLG